MTLPDWLRDEADDELTTTNEPQHAEQTEHADKTRTEYFVSTGKRQNSKGKLVTFFVTFTQAEYERAERGELSFLDIMERTPVSFKDQKAMAGSAGSVYTLETTDGKMYNVSRAKFVGRFPVQRVVMHWVGESKEAEASEALKRERAKGTSTAAAFETLKPIRHAMSYMSAPARAHLLAAVIHYLTSKE